MGNISNGTFSFRLFTSTNPGVSFNSCTISLIFFISFSLIFFLPSQPKSKTKMIAEILKMFAKSKIETMPANTIENITGKSSFPTLIFRLI